MVQHKAIHIMADQQKVVYDLSNCAIFNDHFQWPWIFKKRYKIQT